jgi:hypothetical protein
MSHFKLLVTKTNKLALAKQLAPFEEVDGHDRAHCKWDWYLIGGRWRGYFKLQPGAVGALGQPGAYDNKPRFDADVARAGDIDWAGMRAADVADRKSAWREFQRVRRLDGPLSPDETVARFDVFEGYDYASHIARSIIGPDAVLHDGVWQERPIVSWLVGGDGPPPDRDTGVLELPGILASLAPEDELAFVDYHI